MKASSQRFAAAWHAKAESCDALSFWRFDTHATLRALNVRLLHKHFRKNESIAQLLRLARLFLKVLAHLLVMLLLASL